jgi:hypothetical protein
LPLSREQRSRPFRASLIPAAPLVGCSGMLDGSTESRYESSTIFERAITIKALGFVDLTVLLD